MDEQFLRASRDFLSVVAHPATVETISITREHIKTRAAYKLSGWYVRLRKWRRSIRSSQYTSEDDGFKDSAHSLARMVGWAERLALLATGLAIFFSGHAMVGRLIINQEKDALTTYEALTKSADTDRIGLFRIPGAAALVDPNPDHGCPAQFHLAAPNHDGTEQASTNTERHALLSTSGIRIDDPSISAEEAAWALVTECRRVQWALMQLVTENIRLKSWDEFYISTWARYAIGWDRSTIKMVRKALNQNFCDAVAAAYHENPGVGCKKILDLMVRDSSSVANSVLGWLTMYILPCLYAFIGAAAAAVIGIRRKLNGSLLSYADRGWVKQALILGFVFGGIIGLFAGYLAKSPDSNGLGLSALALLAGYNVPAVSEMLEDLSKRIFRPGERDTQATKAA